jgi:hypothetical protein
MLAMFYNMLPQIKIQFFDGIMFNQRLNYDGILIRWPVIVGSLDGFWPGIASHLAIDFGALSASIHLYLASLNAFFLLLDLVFRSQ